MCQQLRSTEVNNSKQINQPNNSYIHVSTQKSTIYRTVYCYCDDKKKRHGRGLKNGSGTLFF